MRTRRSQSSSDPVLSSNLPAQAGHRLSSLMESKHIPVLLHEIVEALSLVPSDVVVDATLGGAGHAAHIAKKLGKNGVLIGFDLDSEAIARGKHALEGVAPKVHLV